MLKLATTLHIIAITVVVIAAVVAQPKVKVRQCPPGRGGDLCQVQCPMRCVSCERGDQCQLCQVTYFISRNDLIHFVKINLYVFPQCYLYITRVWNLDKFIFKRRFKEIFFYLWLMWNREFVSILVLIFNWRLLQEVTYSTAVFGEICSGIWQPWLNQVNPLCWLLYNYNLLSIY